MNAPAPGFLLLLLTSSALADDPRVVVEPSAPSPPSLARIDTDAARLTFGSVLQLDSSNGGERPGFSVHRARLSLDAEVERLQGLGGFVQIGVGEGDRPSPLLDAVVRFRIVGRGGPNLGEIQIGRRKVPVSREVLQDPQDLAFVDRSPSTSLAPLRDTGLLYHLALARPKRRFSLDVGFWNGEPAGDRAAGGTSTSVRVGAGAGDAGRARAGMDWGLGYALERDAESDLGLGAAVTLAVDGEIRHRALSVAAELLSVVHELAGSSRGFAGSVRYYLIADTFELRGRAEMLDAGDVAHAVTLGATFYYLAPRLRLLVDHTQGISGPAENDGRTVTSFLFVL